MGNHKHESAGAVDLEVTPEMLEACANLVFDTAVDASVAHTLLDMAKELRNYNAKLAEEETRAETVSRCPICFGPNGSHHMIHERYPAGGGGTNKPCPNSSPHVPTLTETEWPSLGAVPAHVHTVMDKVHDEYRRRKNGGWKIRQPGGRWSKITSSIDEFDSWAPFTAVAKKA